MKPTKFLHTLTWTAAAALIVGAGISVGSLAKAQGGICQDAHHTFAAPADGCPEGSILVGDSPTPVRNMQTAIELAPAQKPADFPDDLTLIGGITGAMARGDYKLVVSLLIIFGIGWLRRYGDKAAHVPVIGAVLTSKLGAYAMNTLACGAVTAYASISKTGTVDAGTFEAACKVFAANFFGVELADDLIEFLESKPWAWGKDFAKVLRFVIGSVEGDAALPPAPVAGAATAILIGLTLFGAPQARAAEFVPHLTKGAVGGTTLNFDGTTTALGLGLYAGMNLFHVTIDENPHDIGIAGVLYGQMFGQKTGALVAGLGPTILTYGIAGVSLALRDPNPTQPGCGGWLNGQHTCRGNWGVFAGLNIPLGAPH